MAPDGIAVVVGVGPKAGLGAALARRFAQAGLKVFICGRTLAKLQPVADDILSQGGIAIPFVLDASSETEVTGFFQHIKNQESLPLILVACNVDSNERASILETGSDMFTQLWKQNAYAGFLVGREAAKLLLERGQGTLLFTGASASLRAKPPFTAFASAKFALRALAQGMARELGPKGIHVVHVIIDGVLDGDRAQQNFPEFVVQKGRDGLINLVELANTYWYLHCQPKSVWTHELDLRPFKEPF